MNVNTVLILIAVVGLGFFFAILDQLRNFEEDPLEIELNKEDK